MARNKITFKLDTKGINEILKTEFREETRAAAEGIAASIEQEMAHHPAEHGVLVEEYTSAERTGHRVTIASPRGMYYALVRGSLARAAGAQGLEVKG